MCVCVWGWGGNIYKKELEPAEKTELVFLVDAAAFELVNVAGQRVLEPSLYQVPHSHKMFCCVRCSGCHFFFFFLLFFWFGSFVWRGFFCFYILSFRSTLCLWR